MSLTAIPQPCCETRVEVAKKIATLLSKELGFLPRSAFMEAAKKNSLLVIEDLAFIKFHVRKDDQITIYEIGVMPEASGKGLGKQLIGQVRLIALLRRKKRIIAKCPEDLPSNGFYDHIGFEKIGIQAGKKRRLNIWSLSV